MNVIQIESLWKEYRLGMIGHGTLTHDLQSWWARLRGKEDPNSTIRPLAKSQNKQSDGIQFWALNDVNLKVTQGEVLGIIGKNGAGKSTLLKILSRVTAPTKGCIKVKGRIASLLEVGTGFHPELTGRENIYLNGAILGMSKKEVNSKFDEIVDFSGVETFIDTPVKRYSSGMYVRLAFAVAAHLEPEILVVDEVLAVGDAEFQKKCLGKMNDVASQGRTVLFVSHNMAALGNLCKKAILLDRGRIVKEGLSNDIIDFYLNRKSAISDTSLLERQDRRGNGVMRVKELRILIGDEEAKAYVRTGDNVKFRILFNIYSKKMHKCRFSINIDKGDQHFIILDSYVARGKYIEISDIDYLDFEIENLPLSRGVYTISLFLASETDVFDWINNVTELVVEDGDYYGTGRQYPDGWAGKTVLVKYSVLNKDNLCNQINH